MANLGCTYSTPYTTPYTPNHSQTLPNIPTNRTYDYYYLLPYYKYEPQDQPLSTIYSSPTPRYLVLLAKKKSFNIRDGFIHHNPGQMVICGGKKLVTNKRNDNNIIDNCIEIFYKQTGHFIRNKSNITYILENKNDDISTKMNNNHNNDNENDNISTMNNIINNNNNSTIDAITNTKNKNNSNTGSRFFLFYNVSTYNEYISLKKKKLSMITSTYYPEISNIEWIDLHNAIQLFSSIKNNPPCSGQLNLTVNNYISAIFNSGIPKREFVDFFEYAGLNAEFKYKIFENILVNKYNSDFFLVFRSYIKWYFSSRCHMDWFKNACDILCNVLLNVTVKPINNKKKYNEEYTDAGEYITKNKKKYNDDYTDSINDISNNKKKYNDDYTDAVDYITNNKKKYNEEYADIVDHIINSKKNITRTISI